METERVFLINLKKRSHEEGILSKSEATLLPIGWYKAADALGSAVPC